MSADGRDVTSPADTLRALLASPNQHRDPWDAEAADWIEEHGPAVLALLDAAQADVADYLEWRSLPGNEHKATDVMDDLVAAYRALSEPRP